MQGARRDADAFEALRSQLMSQMRFVRANPRVVFSDTLTRLLANNHPRAFAVPDASQMENLRPEVVYSLYDKMFTDANGLTVIVVGNISEAQLPMLAAYLNALPAGRLQLQWKDHGMRFPPQTIDAKVFAGTENQSQVAVNFNSPFDWNDRNRLLMNLATRAYNIKLRENMREELGWGVWRQRPRQRKQAASSHPDHQRRLGYQSITGGYTLLRGVRTDAPDHAAWPHARRPCQGERNRNPRTRNQRKTKQLLEQLPRFQLLQQHPPGRLRRIQGCSGIGEHSRNPRICIQIFQT
ncbi:MAG: hypothetical protein IPM52_00380 [Bacteroidetes bacterium]|nr:hypothetical protein [Bacteroidota bacterium]